MHSHVIKYILLLVLSFSCSQRENMIKVALKPKLQNDVLDPKNISYVNEFILLENLTTRLVSIDQSGSPQLSLASKI